MISEGPSLVEALSGPLHDLLHSLLRPDEELRIAVRSHLGEALAATTTRLLLLREPHGVQEARLDTLSDIRATTRPSGGSLTWSSSLPGAPTSFPYPSFDGVKFTQVAVRLRRMITESNSQVSTPSAPHIAPSASPEPKCTACGAVSAPGDCWCGACGHRMVALCGECGRALRSDACFCTGCGCPVDEAALVSCPGCGAEAVPGLAYCTRCGEQVRSACGDCDRPLRFGWSFCPACGGTPTGEDAEENAGPVPAAPDQPRPFDPPHSSAADGARLNDAGVRAFEAGNLPEAARLFERAAGADPGNGAFWTNLGVARAELGDEGLALAAYRQAVVANPNQADAYLHMGTLFMEREQSTEAREAWEKVIKIAPDSEEAAEARENLRHLHEI